MRAFLRMQCIALVALSIAAVGCRQQGIVPAPVYQNQLQATQQLQTRVSSLDHVNLEKERQLASSRQEVLRLQNHLTQVNQRLKTTADELRLARDARAVAEQRANQALAATQARGGATITANNSLGRNKPQFNIPGVSVGQDADVVRIQVAATSLFAPDAATLNGNASNTLNQIAAQLARAYPNQRIGIEGHTDSSPLPANSRWQSQHQLSTARAMAVYNHIASGGQLRTEQLHVAGHGSNHPRYSNTSTTARDANQRIELVVYPEQIGGLGR